jgi:uncharacterized membrane protein
MISKLLSGIKKSFVAGLLLILPLIITLLILRFLFGIIMALFSPTLLHLFPVIPIWLKTLISVVILIILVCGLGILTGHFLGQWFWNRFEHILMQIPLLRSIYSASREVVGVFCGSDQTNFKEVALVEFPRAGMKSLGFITGTLIDDKGNDCFKIFIPTTPNPTTGFLEIVEKSQVVRCNMSVEDSIKMIMSGGILGPEGICSPMKPYQPPQVQSSEFDSQKGFGK